MLNMPAVAAKVNRDTVRTRELANRRSRNRVGLIGSPGLADRCDVIDIYRQERHEYLPAIAFQRIRTRSKNMRTPSRRNLTLLPSALLHRTGASRIVRPL